MVRKLRSSIYLAIRYTGQTIFRNAKANQDMTRHKTRLHEARLHKTKIKYLLLIDNT
jgi:hypothetical protein